MTDFRLATRADDAVLRALLRENGLPTWVEMAIEREPSFFAGTGQFGDDWAVIASEGEDTVGMYTASVLPVHVDGVGHRVGYLGGLRVAARHRRRIRHLREGYASIRRLAQASATLPWWFTAVSAENISARRLLESGVAGLPAYVPIGRYVTVALSRARSRRGGAWRRAGDADVAELVAFHNDHAKRLQLSPLLDEAHVRQIGVDCFLVHERGGAIAGVAALWDQRQFKQLVARRYRAPIGALLPAYNAYARLFGRVPLPRAGSALQHTFVAFLEIADDALDDGRALIEELLTHCATPVAALGLHSAHPLLAAVRSLAPIRYEACLYAVSFDARPNLAALPVQPEAALL